MFKSFLNRGGSNNNNNNKDDGVSSSTSKRDVVVKKKSDNDDDDDSKLNNNNDDTTTTITTTTKHVVDNNDADDHIVTDNNTDKKKEVDDDDDKNKNDHDHDATNTTTTPGGGAAEPEEEVENTSTTTTTSSSSSSFTSRWRLAAKKTFANAATAASAAVATATATTTSSSSSAAAAAKPTTTTPTTITSTSGATVTRSSSIKRANSSSTRNAAAPAAAAAAALVPPVVLDGPSVYDDAKSMLAGAMIIYFFADIRDMAREGLIEQTLESLEPPLTVEKVIETITQNREELTKRSIDHEDLKQRLEIFKSSNNNNNTSNNNGKDGNSGSNIFRSLLSSAGGGSSNNFSNSAKNKPPPAILKQFVDTKAHEEIVHGIVVNHAQRRISVIFRGSVTQKDFIQDAKCSQLKVVNPVSVMIVNKDHTTENIGIHTGFYEYLFKEQTTVETTANEAQGTTPPSTSTSSTVVVGKTRYHDIMDHIKSSLREHPGYSLYFSGHSLGGALCTLCGFYAATDNELCMLVQPSNKPIQIYSIASPYVGNWKFKQAFQYLERMKRVQHLRIANHEDLVTLMPFAVPKLTALSPALSILKGAGNLYKHCGMKLQFIQDQDQENNNNNNDNTLQEQNNKEDDDDGKEEEEEVVGNESERSTTIPAAGAATASSSCRQKLYSISYPKDHEAIDDIEYKKELNDNIMAGKSLGSALYYIMKRDIERVTRYHSCEEYERRLTLYCGSNGVSDCSTDFDEADDDDDDNDNAGNNNLSTRSSSSSSRLLPPPPPQLRYVTLNDLYNDRSIVGNILDIDYIPKKPETGAIQIAKRAFHGYFGTSSSNKDKSNNNNNNSMDDNDDNDNDEKKESTNNNNN